MKVCDKCRCRSVCGIKDKYDHHYASARKAYDPGEEVFEITLRCKSYIPDKKKEEQYVSGTARN